MIEIERFNKEIRQDLVEMLKGFVANQVEILYLGNKVILVAVVCTII